jgi:xylulokinase
MLQNKTVGSHIANLNLNKHSNAHLCRATLEGIAFSYVYGNEILKSDGVNIHVIKAGNDNLFRSEIFSNTVATLINRNIEIYNSTGSVGAARACGISEGRYNDFSEITKNDYVKTYYPLKNKDVYLNAYNDWKKVLETLLKY